MRCPASGWGHLSPAHPTRRTPPNPWHLQSLQVNSQQISNRRRGRIEDLSLKKSAKPVWKRLKGTSPQSPPRAGHLALGGLGASTHGGILNFRLCLLKSDFERRFMGDFRSPVSVSCSSSNDCQYRRCLLSNPWHWAIQQVSQCVEDVLGIGMFSSGCKR